MMKILRNIFGNSGRQAKPSPVYAEELSGLAGRRAENFFREHGLSCSEAALLVINHGFGGGLTTAQVLSLGNGFGGGVGGSGCVCGALSGAVMALGVFLGPGSKKGLGKNKFRKLVADFQEGFRAQSGSVCCRELIVDFRKDRRGRRHFCSGLTGRCTAEVAKLIIRERPEIAGGADLEFLRGHDSGISEKNG